MAGRRPNTSLDRLRTASTFRLLANIYEAKSASDLGRKLSSAKAISKSDVEGSTRHWFAGRRCLGIQEITHIADKTALVTQNPEDNERIIDYFSHGPEQLFMALSGQQPSYYMKGPENTLQGFVIVIYELQRSPIDSISFRIAYSDLSEMLRCINDGDHYLSIKWLDQALLELLKSKSPVNEPIPAPLKELLRRELNQILLRNRPERLFPHQPSDDEILS